MQIISLFLLFILYAIAMEGFIDIFSSPLGIESASLQFSLLLSGFGIGLGFLFYVLSKITKSIKRIIVLGIPGFLLLLFLVTYLLFGVYALFDLIVLLVKICFGLMMCSTSLIGTYGLLKRQQKTIIATRVSILFFFFFVKILLADFISFVDPVELLILFFILFICYLEFGTNSIFFDSAISKMMPTDKSDESILLRFNNLINKYYAYIFIVLGICYVISLIILNYGSYFSSVTGGEIMNIQFGSVYGIWLLVGITIVCALLFWYLIPKEKTKIL